MKKIVDFETFVHYGCSFTYGEDSGGDGIDDDSLSYPAHLSKLCNNEYINQAGKGTSNDTSFFKLFCDISNGEIKKNSLVIFNLSSMHRTIYFTQSDTTEYPLKGNKIRYLDVLPNFVPELSRPIVKKIKSFKEAYYYQTDHVFHFNLIKNIYAAKQLCIDNNIPILFVDTACNLYRYNHDNYTNYKQIKILKFGDYSLVGYVGKDKTMLSKSGHFYSEGYRMMAKALYDLIKDSKI